MKKTHQKGGGELGTKNWAFGTGGAWRVDHDWDKWGGGKSRLGNEPRDKP